MAGVKQEIWTGRVVEQLTAAEKGTFLEGITDESRYVQNDAIHLVDVGADPNVLVNNTTYPIPTTTLAEADISISLDKFDTENTRVTDDELHAITYNKIDEVIRKHVRAIAAQKMRKYIHALGAGTASDLTPIVRTTGTVKNGLKMITIADILSLKEAFDKMEVPEEQRVLVLSAEHINQLLALDQKFAGQYYDAGRGQWTPLFYGFKIHTYVANPHYHTNGTTGKLAFGATPTANHQRGSVAFWEGGAFKANGSMTMYYADAKQDPAYRQTVVGFRSRGICLPVKERAIGAIISVA